MKIEFTDEIKDTSCKVLVDGNHHFNLLGPLGRDEESNLWCVPTGILIFGRLLDVGDDLAINLKQQVVREIHKLHQLLRKDLVRTSREVLLEMTRECYRKAWDDGNRATRELFSSRLEHAVRDSTIAVDATLEIFAGAVIKRPESLEKT